MEDFTCLALEKVPDGLLPGRRLPRHRLLARADRRGADVPARRRGPQRLRGASGNTSSATCTPRWCHNLARGSGLLTERVRPRLAAARHQAASRRLDASIRVRPEAVAQAPLAIGRTRPLICRPNARGVGERPRSERRPRARSRRSGDAGSCGRAARVPPALPACRARRPSTNRCRCSQRANGPDAAARPRSGRARSNSRIDARASAPAPPAARAGSRAPRPRPAGRRRARASASARPRRLDQRARLRGSAKNSNTSARGRGSHTRRCEDVVGHAGAAMIGGCPARVKRGAYRGAHAHLRRSWGSYPALRQARPRRTSRPYVLVVAALRASPPSSWPSSCFRRGWAEFREPPRGATWAPLAFLGFAGHLRLDGRHLSRASRFSTAANAASCSRPATPVMVAIGARFYLGERPAAARGWGGAVVASSMAGVWTASSRGKLARPSRTSSLRPGDFILLMLAGGLERCTPSTASRCSRCTPRGRRPRRLPYILGSADAAAADPGGRADSSPAPDFTSPVAWGVVLLPGHPRLGRPRLVVRSGPRGGAQPRRGLHEPAACGGRGCWRGRCCGTDRVERPAEVGAAVLTGVA